MSAEKYKIALLLPVGSEYSERLAEGIVASATHQKRVNLVEIRYRDGLQDPLKYKDIDVDGALVWLSVDDLWIEQLLDKGVKVVNANSSWKGRIPYAVFDGQATARAAAEHLIQLGQQHAAFIGWATSLDPRKENPMTWFRGHCQEAGVNFSAHDLGAYPGMEDPVNPVPPEVMSRLVTFLVELPKPAAIWCEDDHLARLICDTAIKADLHVPGDLAICGTGDMRIALMSEPQLTTIPLPAQSVGGEMLRLLLHLLDGDAPTTEPVLIPPQPLIARNSTKVTDTSVDTLYYEAHRWIHSHACEGVTVNELMETVTVSQRKFTERFTEIFGRTPGKEIRHVRLEQAKSYLRQTSHTIDWISQLCGYDQPAKFTNFFNRETGMPPSTYRKKNRKVSRTIADESAP